MVRIRRFEEEAGKLMEDGKIPGALHLYVGQEAVASGVMEHLSNQGSNHQHPPGAWTPDCKGRGVRSNVRRAFRAINWLLQRQGWQHAHL